MSSQEDRDRRSAQQRARRIATRKCGLHGNQAIDMQELGTLSIPICPDCGPALEAISQRDRGCAFDEVHPRRVRPENRVSDPVHQDSQQALTLRGIVADLWDWLWGN